MSIIYNEAEKLFTIQTVGTTYQMKVDEYGFLLHLYYGARIEGSMEYMLTHYDRGFSGNPYDAGDDRTYSMDALPQEYPSEGNGDYRSIAFMVRNQDKTYSCDLRYKEHKIYDGKYSLKGLPSVYVNEGEKSKAQSLEIVLEDRHSLVQVKLLYGVLASEDIITRSAVVTNLGEGEITVEKAGSACLDFLEGDYELISFYGRHAMERNFQRSEIVHGCQSIGSRRGTSSHQYNPAAIIARKDTTENSGECYGMMFVYSGNFQLEAQKDPFNQTRVIMGLQSDLFSYPLKKGEELYIPETILAYSNQGIAHMSHLYHRCIREHICRGKYKSEVRPILINSWEAAYFDFNAETIYQLAKNSAELGIDMVVMDDGWFGKRNDDNSGLGDWYVNEEKLGCSLEELIKKVNSTGVKFGIWIEPEMVSEDSDLYRSHPDYALVIPNRKPIKSRNQLVLDFSRKEVRDCIFHQICAVLDKGNIEYIKWDMNRSITDWYSDKTDIGRLTYDYMLGVYDFLEKLIERYPDILIEGCSGGGGRFDAGMLYYTLQIWCSDNTDAIDRLKIQYGTSFFYPSCVAGAHVSAVPNHQTGRSVSMNTRGIVAMAGTFGYELNPSLLSEEEKQEIRQQTSKYRQYSKLINEGDYYRLSDPFTDEKAAWMYVSPDKRSALVNVIMQEIHGNMTVNYIKLKGLQPDAVYEDVESGRKYFGSALMNGGMPLPVEMGEYRGYQINLKMEESYAGKCIEGA